MRSWPNSRRETPSGESMLRRRLTGRHRFPMPSTRHRDFRAQFGLLRIGVPSCLQSTRPWVRIPSSEQFGVAQLVRARTQGSPPSQHSGSPRTVCAFTHHKRVVAGSNPAFGSCAEVAQLVRAPKNAQRLRGDQRKRFNQIRWYVNAFMPCTHNNRVQTSNDTRRTM